MKFVVAEHDIREADDGQFRRAVQQTAERNFHADNLEQAESERQAAERAAGQTTENRKE